MGARRINPSGNNRTLGVCGATADTIAARHIARMIASGTAALSDHGLEVVDTTVVTISIPNSLYFKQ